MVFLLFGLHKAVKKSEFPINLQFIILFLYQTLLKEVCCTQFSFCQTLKYIFKSSYTSYLFYDCLAFFPWKTIADRTARFVWQYNCKRWTPHVCHFCCISCIVHTRQYSIFYLLQNNLSKLLVAYMFVIFCTKVDLLAS